MSAIHLSIHPNRHIDERFKVLSQTYLVINLNYILDESVDTHQEEF